MIVTVTRPLGLTLVGEKDLVARGPKTVTLESPPTGVFSLSKSLRVPEKVWGPASLEAVTVYVKEVSPCRVNLTSWPVARTCSVSRLLET